MNLEHQQDSPQGGFPSWPAVPAPWSAWSGWMAWVAQWQQAWMSVLGAWPGLNGVRPTLPLLWDPGFLMPRVDARITPVTSDEGREAARLSMMMRMPRFGCLGPADLVAVEAFIARRPDPAALVEALHPVQAVPPLPAPGAAPVGETLPASGTPAGTPGRRAKAQGSRKAPLAKAAGKSVGKAGKPVTGEAQKKASGAVATKPARSKRT